MTTSKDSTATTERKPSTKPSSKWMQYMTETAQAYAKTVAGTVTDSENRAAKESQSEAMRLVGNQAQRVDPADLGITTENAEQERDKAKARQKEIQARIASAADNPAQLKKVLTEWHSINLLIEAASNVQRSARKQQGEADRLRETSERLAAENQRKRRQDDRAARLKNLDANPLVDESLDRRESELKTAIDAGDATRARQLLNPFIIQSQKLGLSTQAGMKAGNIVFSHNNDVQRLESMTSPNDLRQFASTQKDWAGRNAEKKQEVQDWLASLPDEQLRWLSDAPGGHYYGFDASRVLQRRTDGGSAQPVQPAPSTPAPEFAPASVKGTAFEQMAQTVGRKEKRLEELAPITREAQQEALDEYIATQSTVEAERVVTYTGPGGGPAGTVVTDLDADIAKAERDTQKAQREFEAKSAKVLNATPETHSMKQRRNLRIASDQAAQGLRTTRLRLEALKAAQGVEVPVEPEAKADEPREAFRQITAGTLPTPAPAAGPALRLADRVVSDDDGSDYQANLGLQNDLVRMAAPTETLEGELPYYSSTETQDKVRQVIADRGDGSPLASVSDDDLLKMREQLGQLSHYFGTRHGMFSRISTKERLNAEIESRSLSATGPETPDQAEDDGGGSVDEHKARKLQILEHERNKEHNKVREIAEKELPGYDYPRGDDDGDYSGESEIRAFARDAMRRVEVTEADDASKEQLRVRQDYLKRHDIKQMDLGELDKAIKAEAQTVLARKASVEPKPELLELRSYADIVGVSRADMRKARQQTDESAALNRAIQRQQEKNAVEDDKLRAMKAGQDAVMLEESRGDVDMGGEYTLRGGAASVPETPIDRLSEIEAMPEWATVQAKDLHQAYTPKEKVLLSEHSDLRRARHLSEAEANFPEQERSEIVQTLIAAKESELRAEGMSDSDVGEEIQHLTQLYSQRSPTAKTGPSALDERERLLKIIESAQQKSAVTATPTIITAAPNAGPEPQPINISITVIDDNDTVQPPPVMQTIEEQAETRTAAAAAAKPKKKSAPKSSTPSLASCAPENVTNTIEGLALELKLQEEELDKVQASTGSKGGVSKLERLELAQKAVSRVQRRIRTEEKKLGVACPLPAAKKGPSAYAQAGKRAAKGRTGTHPAVKMRSAARATQKQKSGARG